MSVLQVTPVEAFKILQKENQSILIDVRTPQELDSVGFVDCHDFAKKDNNLTIPWRLLPKMDYNENFKDELLSQLKVVGADEKSHLFFMCKVGGRSLEAASFMTSLGFENCYNIIGGFEDWKRFELPWKIRTDVKPNFLRDF